MPLSAWSALRLLAAAGSAAGAPGLPAACPTGAACQAADEASLLQRSSQAVVGGSPDVDTCSPVPFTTEPRVDVSDINSSFPMYIGKSPLPGNYRGVFWTINDGSGALISLGAPPGGGEGECSNGKLTQQGNKWCTKVSTVRGGAGHGAGWAFQAVGTPGNTPYPSDPVIYYQACGVYWQFCFDDPVQPTSGALYPINTTKNSLFESVGKGCNFLNRTSAAFTYYQGVSEIYGGHVWNVTTWQDVTPDSEGVRCGKAIGCFDVVQVMDEWGQKVQPAWDMFAANNSQIVYHKAP